MSAEAASTSSSSSSSSSSAPTTNTTTTTSSSTTTNKSNLFNRLRGWWQNRPRRNASTTAAPAEDADDVLTTHGYSLNERIGVGEFATVHRAERLGVGPVAVKLFSRATEGANASATARIEREAELLKLAAPHRNVVAFVELIGAHEKCGSSRKARQASSNVRAIVMEFVDGCDLLALMRARASVFAEREARDLFSQLLRAVAHLHATGIAHRDIKLENVLVSRPDNVVKLCDFGFARRVVSADDRMATLCGSPSFLAPELARRREYTLAVDAWACGVVLFVMLSGSPPFHASSEAALLRLIARGSFQFDADEWCTVSDAAKRLVSALLTVDVRERATPADALAHEWFADADATATATATTATTLQSNV